LNSLHYSVWDIFLTEIPYLSVKKGVNRLRTQRSSECYLRQMA